MGLKIMHKCIFESAVSVWKVDVMCLCGVLGWVRDGRCGLLLGFSSGAFSGHVAISTAALSSRYIVPYSGLSVGATAHPGSNPGQTWQCSWSAVRRSCVNPMQGR